MKEDFVIKKVDQETLGEYLCTVRKQLRLSVSSVAKKTGVLEKFILYLEEGKYQFLPPDVYVLGILRKIAELYLIPEQELVDQYRKEREIFENTTLGKIAEPKKWRLGISQLSITPKVISVAFGLFFGAGAVVYVLVQVFLVNSTPTLVITEPHSNTILRGSSVEIKGRTDAGTSLSVNGENILVAQNGNFSVTLGVAPGQKDFRLVAKNKFGKEKVELISLRIDEPQVAGDATTRPSQLILDLIFTKETVISIKRDGVDLLEEVIPSGAKKTIIANDLIELNTSDAGSTQAILNGQQLGVLGKVGQRLSIPFTINNVSELKN